MIGVYDSGRGGERVADELRALMPGENILLLCDRQHAPFGTKSERELKKILTSGVKRLVCAGVRRVLVGCCTMCTVLDGIDGEYSDLCDEIILPTARRAVTKTKNRKIALIGTERTVRSGAFVKTVSYLSERTEVFGIEAQELVAISEGGGIVTEKDERSLDLVAKRVEATGADTLILGCTHFGEVAAALEKRLPHISIVDSAREGARAFYLRRGEKEEDGLLINL